MPPESCRRRDHFELETRGKCNSGGQIRVALNDGGLQGSGKHREAIVRNGMDEVTKASTKGRQRICADS